MGPDDALRLADWVGGLFPEATPRQIEYLSGEFAAFDVAVVEQEVTRFRRHFDSFNPSNLLRRIGDAQAKHRAPRSTSAAEREQVVSDWKRNDEALSSLSDAELRGHKDAILAQNPALRSFLADKDPRRSVVLRSLILDRRSKWTRG